MPALSVLIPCFNVASTVDETLSSLASQTLTDFEAVLVDDGSSDGTLDHLQEWSHRDRRFRAIHLSHCGIIPALNVGLAECRSEYIARLDADDRAAPTRLKLQLDALVSQPGLALVGGLVAGFPEASLDPEFMAYIEWLNSLSTDEDIKNSMFVRSPLAHPSVAYRRAWVERVGGYQDHGWAEDYDLWMRLYLAGAVFSKIPEVLVEWRDHPHRLTHTDSRYSKQNDLILKAHYLANGPLLTCSEVMIFGSGITALQLGERLRQIGCPPSAYVGSQPLGEDADNKDVATISPEELNQRLRTSHKPVVLIADEDPERVSNVLQQFSAVQFQQGIDWFLVN